MATQYLQYGLNLSKFQIDKINAAAKAGNAVDVKLKANQLAGEHPVLITQTQLDAIEKKRKAGQGYLLRLSATQLENIQKQGGFGWLIPMIAKAVLPTVGTWAAKKIYNKIRGNGEDGAGLFLHGPIPPRGGETIITPQLHGGLLVAQNDFLKEQLASIELAEELQREGVIKPAAPLTDSGTTTVVRKRPVKMVEAPVRAAGGRKKKGV